MFLNRCLIILFLTTLSVFSADKVPDHPRILFPKSEEAKIKQRIKTDPLAADIYKKILLRADQIIDAPTCSYNIRGGRRLLRECRIAQENIIFSSMAWRLTGEKKYHARAIKELDAATSLKDWNSRHFLDTAEMSTGVAIGYDWLYQSLTTEQRDRYATALREKGLEKSRWGFGRPSKPWWTKGGNNWTQVCVTGHLFAERALEKQGDPIHPSRIAAVESLKKCHKLYKPGGGYPEGPDYWHYGSCYQVLGMAIVRGDHPSLSYTTPAEFKVAPLFVEHLTGPTGIVFNFADGGPSYTRRTVAQSWMAREFNDPTTCHIIRAGIANDLVNKNTQSLSLRDRLYPLHLLWLPEKPASPTPPLPLDSVWHGTQPIATFRSAWDDPDAMYFAIKAGYPKASHGQMDVGSFIIESDGIRWAHDLGKDNYNLPGYFGGKRWTYYRLTNFSHNTLVIDGKPQYLDAKPSRITQFASHPTHGTVEMNITQSYQKQAAKVIRSGKFDRANHSITITDAITAPTGPVRWAIVTSADIEINGKTVTLKESGKSIKITRNDSHGGEWTFKAAKPKLAAENQNEGMRVLSFTAQPAQELELSVTVQRP